MRGLFLVVVLFAGAAFAQVATPPPPTPSPTGSPVAPPVFIPMATTTPTSAPTSVSTKAAPTMTTIMIAPANQTITHGTKLQLTGTAIYSDGTLKALNGSTWTSSATGVATVSAGLVTAVAAGHATITVKANGASASTTVTVQ